MNIGIGTETYYSMATDLTNKTSKTGILEGKLQGDITTDEELMDVCKSFESYMLEQVFKGMEKTVLKSDEDESPYLQQFGDMLHQEYAQSATEGTGVGIAQLLYESMKRN